MNKKLKFITRVTLIHVATYILCGIIFSTLFNYHELFQLGNTKYFMREFEGVSTLIGPLLQVFRGIIFGLILLLLKEPIIEKKYGWLKLWGIIAVIGIINTPGPAPFSIEGMIYTQLPLLVHLKGAPEILIQTLLFSILVARPPREKKNAFIEKNKLPIISAVIAWIGLTLSGILLSIILKTDIMAGTTDIGAFVIMFAAMTLVFLMSKWYLKSQAVFRHILLILGAYLALAGAPTLYNWLTGSPLSSWLALVINIVPVVIIFIVNYKTEEQKNIIEQDIN